MRQKAAQQLTYKSHVIVRLKSGKSFLLSWSSGSDFHKFFDDFRLHSWFFCIEKSSLSPSHPIPSHTHTVLTVSAVVLWDCHRHVCLQSRCFSCVVVIVAMNHPWLNGPQAPISFAVALSLRSLPFICQIIPSFQLSNGILLSWDNCSRMCSIFQITCSFIGNA